LAKENERHDLFAGLESRFGISEGIFEDYYLFKKKDAWWLLKKSECVVSASSLKIWKAGIKAFQKIGNFVKPTTRIIQQFGKFATRSILEINNDAISLFMKNKVFPVNMELENGYVILSMNGVILGLGLLVNGTIISQIPAKELRIWD
jgi:NOL1/NOP2/fmu family ribosome biogenesis protein